MKLTFRQIEPFIQNPDVAARVILIYGPDEGLMRERTKIIAKKLVEDLSDPFNTAYIKGEDLADEAGRLSDEAHSMSMMGGARVIFVEAATEKSVPAIKAYLENPSDSNLVIVQGGDLSPKSSLRGLCERAKNAAALPCYVEDGQNLSRTISTILSDKGLNIERDALAYLTQNLAGDRGQVLSELEKLITYMGTEKNVTLTDAMANTGSLSEQKLDDFVNACAGGNAIQAEKLVEGMTAEGVASIAMLRSLQRHFRRLLQVKLEMENGAPIDLALKKLQPPLFFKLEPPFKAQLQKWPSEKIFVALRKINDLETELKKTNAAENLLINRTVFGLSQMGAR